MAISRAHEGPMNLALTERDLADLKLLREPSPERDVLSELAGFRIETATDAALLHVIFTAGLRAIREKAEERAYASAAVARRARGEEVEARCKARRRR